MLVRDISVTRFPFSFLVDYLLRHYTHGVTESLPSPDFADIAVRHWRRERPDLDLAAMATLARFARLHIVGGQLVDEVFERFGLDRGEFDVLASLRRTGAPFAMAPSRLSEILLITRAGVTKRVDRLERRGLVRRQTQTQTEDRRSRHIELTPEGRTLVDEVVTEHTKNESRLLAALDPAEREAFDRALRTLLTAASDMTNRPA